LLFLFFTGPVYALAQRAIFKTAAAVMPPLRKKIALPKPRRLAAVPFGPTL